MVVFDGEYIYTYILGLKKYILASWNCLSYAFDVFLMNFGFCFQR